MRIALIVFGAAMLAGCQPDDVDNFVGEPSSPYFPFDGKRTWQYISTDLKLTYKRSAEMRSTEPDVIDNTNTYPVDYWVRCVQHDDECETGIERTITWSSDQIDGVRIWNWTEGNRDTVYFDPPLKIAAADMKIGQTYHTVHLGVTWTSTLVAKEECPIRYDGGPDLCLRFSITDGDDDPETGKGLVGDYWAGPGFNVVGFQFPGEEGVWELARSECEGCDEDRGRW